MDKNKSLQIIPSIAETINVPSPALWEPEVAPPSTPISHYLWVLRRSRWKIVLFVIACVSAAALISFRITPMYESTATVDIDRQTPTGVIGQEAARTQLNDSDQFLATQSRLIQSDSVLRPVVQRLKLHEREQDAAGNHATSAVAAEEAPMVLKRLKVTRPPNTYLLQISYRSSDPQLAAAVANGVAQSYLEHTFNIRYKSSANLSAFMEKQMEELKAKMERSSAALAQFERELNVVNAEEKTSILSARLLQLNTEYTAAQADRVRKEAAFNSVQSGTMEAAQVSQQGEALKKLTERLDEAQQKFVEVKSHYGSNHPEYRKWAAQLAEVHRQLDLTRQGTSRRVEVEFRQAVNREAMLERAVAQQKKEFDRLNSRSFEYQALKREAEADKKLYEELVRKIKEAGINASFHSSSIRIADQARPAKDPVSPNLKLNLVLALLISVLVSVGVAIFADMLDDTVRDPEQAVRSLKTHVVGTLPAVKSWRSNIAKLVGTSETKALMPVPQVHNEAVGAYAEAIRTLRNSILLTDFDRNVRSILVTSASPGEGKSTTAANLAIAHAEQGHRTLLIDGDLRKPSVGRRFHIHNAKGLSNVLTAELDWQEAIVKLDENPHLDILPAGPPSRRASDLIGRGLTELLEQAMSTYDLVILDGPPLPGFAEPLQMATAVDGVLVVARAGETSRKAIASVIATLSRLRANVIGLVLNEVNKDMSQSYHYYGHYGKYYQLNERAS